MFIKLKNKKNKGFSIGEVVLAIFVLSVGILAVFSLFNKGIKNLQNERDLIVASLLAQEGVEVVRNIRDNNWAERIYPTQITNPETFSKISLVNKNNCFVNYDYEKIEEIDCNNGKDASERYLYLNGDFYEKTGSDKTKFKRRIIFEDDGKTPIESLKVTSMVDWGDREEFLNLEKCIHTSKCVFSQSVLTNWGTGT